MWHLALTSPTPGHHTATVTRRHYTSSNNSVTHICLYCCLWLHCHCIVKAIDIVLSPPVRMIGYVSEHQKSDHLIHPPDKKNNPWTEKVSSEQCNLMQIDKYDWWLSVVIILFILTFIQKSKKQWTTNYKITILPPRRVVLEEWITRLLANESAINIQCSNWKPIICNSRTSAVSAASRRDA